MSLITIFTIPKAFEGRTAVLQANALRSWKRLPDVDIVLFGDDRGVRDAAESVEAQHQLTIATTEHGTPLISAAFEHVQQIAESPFLCYANADIVLFEDFVTALRSIDLLDFLAVGGRLNVDVEGELDLTSRETRERFRDQVRKDGTPEPPWGSDVFAWPRAVRWDMPPFAVGRPPWDNWMIYRAKERRIPVVDITQSALIVHQNHDYGHVPQRRGRAWHGPETDRNRALVPNLDLIEHVGHLDGVTHLLIDGRLQKARGRKYLRVKLLSLPVRYRVLRAPFEYGRRLFRYVKRAVA